MQENDRHRINLLDVKTEFRTIFNLPQACKGAAFSQRLRRFRNKAKFTTNVEEVRKLRDENPDEVLEWKWGPFELLAQNSKLTSQLFHEFEKESSILHLKLLI